MITRCHHSASLVMPNGDPRDRFFYLTFTLMVDSYIMKIYKSITVLLVIRLLDMYYMKIVVSNSTCLKKLNVVKKKF